MSSVRFTRWVCDFCSLFADTRNEEGGQAPLPERWVSIVSKGVGFHLCPRHTPERERCVVQGCPLPPERDGRNLCAAHHKRQVRGQPPGLVVPRPGALETLKRNAARFGGTFPGPEQEMALESLVASAKAYAAEHAPKRKRGRSDG